MNFGVDGGTTRHKLTLGISRVNLMVNVLGTTGPKGNST